MVIRLGVQLGHHCAGGPGSGVGMLFFDGQTKSPHPLFAILVFVASTSAQSVMVVHGWRNR